MSRIGKKPIDVPDGVKIEIKGLQVKVSGSLGELQMDCHPRIKVRIDDSDSKIYVENEKLQDRMNRQLHGTMRALIAFGTRYGATTTTSETIGKILEEEGLEVDVRNLKNEKVKDISQYDLIIVGSGLKMYRWTKEPEKFLKKFRRQLSEKKLAIFVSSGAQALFKHEGKTQEMDDAWLRYLVSKTEKYELSPVLMAIFGGVWDYNKMGFFAKTMEAFKHELRAAGIEEVEPGVFDTRDWDEIRNWTTELLGKV